MQKIAFSLMPIRIHEGGLSLDELQLPDGRTFRLLNLPLCLSAKVLQYADHYFAMKEVAQS